MMRAIIIFILTAHFQKLSAYWDKEVQCPEVCTCRLEHESETPIRRFMVQEGILSKPIVTESVVLDNNDVYYDGDEGDFPSNENAYIRSITCIIQTESTVEKLLAIVPKDINSLTLLQAEGSGNKSFDMSAFEIFSDLKIVDIQSASNRAPQQTSFLTLGIDTVLEKLEYLNLERVILRNSKDRLASLNKEDFIFESVQMYEDGRILTLLEKREGDKIVPYKTYLESIRGEEGPLFMGFASLKLLRVYNCDIHHVHREMFSGLHSLTSLILQKNNLQFISDFAFYGLQHLKSLSLAMNNLLNIQITNLAGLLELEYLDLSHNNFSQLSELSLPPFPKLRSANFANNPITVVFPNTFEILNTTYSLIVGGLEDPLTLQSNSFVGLNLLVKLKLSQLNIPIFEREILHGMPNLKALVMSGNIPEIQYDAFLEVTNLNSLILSSCNISKLSVDAFIGLESLKILDLSRNNLSLLPPGIFDVLAKLNELYLHQNHFATLPEFIFSKISLRLIRLNQNPWHCSCEMSDWKPMIVNRIKQKTIKLCDKSFDKGLTCDRDKVYMKYVYENSVAPKCTTPAKYRNWSVFHVMRKQFKCPDYKPKLKKKLPLKRPKPVKVLHNLDLTKTEENLSSTEFPSDPNESLIRSTEVQHDEDAFGHEIDLQFQKKPFEIGGAHKDKNSKFLEATERVKAELLLEDHHGFDGSSLNNEDNSLFP